MIVVYTGPMCSGKSLELIRIYEVMKNVIAFSPKYNTRENGIVSRAGGKIDSIKIKTLSEIYEHLLGKRNLNIIIDEFHLFNQNIADREDVIHILELIREHGDIYIAGLDMDFEGIPFTIMSNVMGIATEVYKLKAVCDCGKPATMSKKLKNGIDRYEIGDKIYKPKCYSCFKKP